MSLVSNLLAAFQAVGTDVGRKQWIPDEPPSPVAGKSYAVGWDGAQWSGWSEVPVAPPLTTFIEGWTEYGLTSLTEILTQGTIHAAASVGPENPTVAGVAFEQTATNTGDTTVPAAGWSGTNWLLERESSAPSPSNIGTANGRLEVTAFVDLPDPSFGTIAGVSDLCESALRRNHYITISNLTPGNSYYFCELYLSYPNSTTRATKIDTAGDSIIFGVDGVGAILEKGVKRFGFVATGTTASFQKYGPDNSSSYMNGFFVTDQGVT